MSTRSLPLRPNLDQLKIQANELHRAHREQQPSAAARIAAHHPEMKQLSPAEVLARTIALADAQLVIAREYGFDSWSKLKHHVELADAVAKFSPHPRFDEAVAAMDAGDLDRLRRLIASDPALVHARTNLEPPYHYFTGATLLHHVAGNPARGRLEGKLPPLPKNSPEIARLLLDAGADVHARTLGPHGGDTMGLLVTSKQASDADVTGPLIDVLLQYGARLDLKSEGALDASLQNHAPRAAEKMIELGAKADVLAAAALGRMDLLRGFFDTEGRLLSRPRRHGQEMADRDAIGLAMLYAYVREQHEAVDDLLEKDGNWNMTGVNNGAALHRAAFAGDLTMVQRLVGKGADTSNRDNPFNSTPLSWADHNKQDAVFQWMREHCRIDLHDAVTFDLRDHVEARLREDPSSVNTRLDHWDIPQGTPLHWAASMNREEAAKILLEKGADPNILAGNGMTPLDVADVDHAAAVRSLLEQHGGKRTAAAKRARARRRPESSVPYRIDEKQRLLQVRQSIDEKEWDTILAVMAEQRLTGLDANGQMTDAVLARIAELDHVTRLELNFSKQITDDGLEHLARMSRLQQLDLSWLPGISDAGVANLTPCDQLESVSLMGTPTGDGAINALTGKRRLRHFKSGNHVTKAGLPLFHQFPAFKIWEGREPAFSLMTFTPEPTSLLLRGSFTNEGLRSLVGLDGLFALNLDHDTLAVTAAGLEPLADLPHLGWLGFDATDEAMPRIAAMPQLRFLMCQDTVAGDEGFVALSRSQSLEYIWGRRCYNLRGRGFSALATMPALRGLSVSCKNVDDEALSTLPRFPALTQLMPMDVPDAGFRHVGRCEQLEALECMYVTDMTDAATAHLAGLSRLTSYRAWTSRITDRSLEVLGRLSSLERLLFENIAGITDAGLAALARLPRLREIELDMLPNVTSEGVASFPAHVRVKSLLS